MANTNNIVTKKTLILHFQDNPGENREFTYEKGDGDIYINSVVLSRKSDQIIYDESNRKLLVCSKTTWYNIIK